MFFTRDYQVSKHLSHAEQERIIGDLERLADRLPTRETILFSSVHFVSLIPGYLFSFMTWRAAFRGYNLVKYGKGRVSTAILASLYPIYATSYIYAINMPELREPYRRENPWYYGFKFAAVQQLANLTILLSNVGCCYVFANANGMIQLPGKGLHQPTVREIFSEMVLRRLRPYAKNVGITAVATSAVMFLVGVGSYNQSLSLLARMNRKSLGLKEYTELSPM